MTSDLIRVLLVDDHAVVRSGMKAVLGTARDLDVVGEASDGRDVTALAQRLNPDVIVMDLSMGQVDGLTAIRELRAAGAPGRILVLTMHGEEEYLMPALEAGAAGYLVKSAADRELVDAVRAVARGDTYVQPSAARVLARGIAKKDENADLRHRYEKLTDREQAVLKMVAEGYTAPEIGEKLFISPKTVDTYKQRVNEKLGLAHRTDYVKLALKLGLLQG